MASYGALRCTEVSWLAPPSEPRTGRGTMEKPAGSAVFDLYKPSASRVYDYLLGGSHNFEVDRDVARQVLRLAPEAAQAAAANRHFMARAVRHLIDRGVRQFLDIGSGIPTVGNVHEVAGAMGDARVAYVDIEPVAVAHSRSILAGNDRTVVVQEDARRPEAIMAHPDIRALLHLDRPVAVLLVAVLHYLVDEDDPHRIVARLRDELVPGSYLVVAHITDESRPEHWARLSAMSRQVGTPVTPRSRVQIEQFFDGFKLVDPGVVWGPQWHPENPETVEQPELSNNLVGVGMKV